MQSVGKWLDIHKDEFGLLFWTATLYFIIRGSNIILDNYTETAFLKRYGVEYLPLVNIANAVIATFSMGLVAWLSVGYKGVRLLSYLLLFCGLTVAGVRSLVPLGLDFIYPVLFVLKSQYYVLLSLLFWNLGNDLFNTRQSKRLFPLITAGGVIGEILGSFGTPILAKAISPNNLLLTYLCTTTLGAVATMHVASRYPATLVLAENPLERRSGAPMIHAFKEVLSVLNESFLLKILILLTFIPNVLIPIMNYQFNFTVDQHFATEVGLLKFFGYFRGTLSIMSLFVLLFAGKIFGRWGLPVALMFHPFNYLFVFLAFLLRFDVVSAMYARMSTSILRTSINAPAMAVVTGLFPESWRALVRPFLRGTVVRVGLVLGAGLVLISQNLFHPRYLSLVAIPLAGVWIVMPFWLKRNYAKILLGLVSPNVLDLKSMEPKDVRRLFADRELQAELLRSFSSAASDECLWYARLLKTVSAKDLDSRILVKLGEVRDDETKIALLDLLTAQAEGPAARVLRDLVDPAHPKLTAAVMEAAARVAPGLAADLHREVFETCSDEEVKARALVCLFPEDPERYRHIVDGWLASGEAVEKRAGAIAAGGSRDVSYIPQLRELLQHGADDSILPHVLTGLALLEAPGLNELVAPYLSYPNESVRASALEATQITDRATLSNVLRRMGDSSEEICRQARRKIETAAYQDIPLLLESLDLPNRKIRENVLAILQMLDIKDLDFFRFAETQIERAYQCLAVSESLVKYDNAPTAVLLREHLTQEALRQAEKTLRVLAARDRSGQLRVLCRGVFSADRRQRANSLEAVSSLVVPSLSSTIVPLLEGLPPSRVLAVGRKRFQLPAFDSDRALFAYLVVGNDWVTVVLALHWAMDQGEVAVGRETILELSGAQNAPIRQTAQQLLRIDRARPLAEEKGRMVALTIPEKILHLKKVEIFDGLAVGELAAVSAVMEEMNCGPGEIIIHEGDIGETLYLILKGEVSVLKASKTDREIDLDHMQEGDYFGEMALFEGVPRSATIRAEKECHLLILHKHEFKEILREYPQIAFHICSVLSGRIRRLHKVVATGAVESE